MEELLNKLIEKGWKPRGESEPIYILSSKRLYIPDTMEVDRSLRDLVSKESGLWQFVCENALYSYINCVWKGCEGPVVVDYIEPQSYKYRLIESALKDESELEQFLLDNIKVDE